MICISIIIFIRITRNYSFRSKCKFDRSHQWNGRSFSFAYSLSMIQYFCVYFTWLSNIYILHVIFIPLGVNFVDLLCLFWSFKHAKKWAMKKNETMKTKVKYQFWDCLIIQKILQLPIGEKKQNYSMAVLLLYYFVFCSANFALWFVELHIAWVQKHPQTLKTYTNE